MANGETVKDLHLDTLRRCGEKDDGTSDYHEQALVYLNKAYRSIIAGSCEFDVDIGECWPWAFGAQEIVLTLNPPVGTNWNQSLTVNLTYNSSSGSFSSPPQNFKTLSNVSVQGWWIQTTASSEWYYITQHTLGSTAFTIDSVFNDTTTTLSSFLCCQLDYTLTAVGQLTSPPTEPGGIMRLTDAMECYRQQDYSNDNEYKIYGVDTREFKRQYPLSIIELGVPTRFCITAQSNTGVFTVRFNKYIDCQSRANIQYIPVPIDLTSNPDAVPIIPIEHRDVLIYIACFWLMKDKTDSRGADYLQLAQAKLKALTQDARKKMDQQQKLKGVLVPRWDQVNQKKRIRYI